MSRSDLDAKLRKFLADHGVDAGPDSNHIFFNPPSTIYMEYPCILYERNDMPTWDANNSKYIINTRYVITIISEDVDDPMPEDLLKTFGHCSFDREYNADNLHHTVFDLYY